MVKTLLYNVPEYVSNSEHQPTKSVYKSIEWTKRTDWSIFTAPPFPSFVRTCRIVFRISLRGPTAAHRRAKDGGAGTHPVDGLCMDLRIFLQCWPVALATAVEDQRTLAKTKEACIQFILFTS